MSNPKEAAKLVAAKATEKHCRFPKIWDEKQLLKECASTALLYKFPDGAFDVESAVEFLLNKFGVEKQAGNVIVIDDDDEETETSTTPKKRNSSGGEEMDGSTGKAKKAKKSETYMVECNRAIGDAIMEMGGIYFKNADPRKGAVFSKAAKAIRETDVRIATKRDAMSLKGVGKGIAAYIEELQQTGTIRRLEEMRAGMA